MWQNAKNVTFVRAMDAIRSTRAHDIQLTFEKEQSITREMVEYAKALSAGDDEEEEEEEEEEDFSRTMMASSATSTSSRREPVSSTPRGPSINRPDAVRRKRTPGFILGQLARRRIRRHRNVERVNRWISHRNCRPFSHHRLRRGHERRLVGTFPTHVQYVIYFTCRIYFKDVSNIYESCI